MKIILSYYGGLAAANWALQALKRQLPREAPYFAIQWSTLADAWMLVQIVPEYDDDAIILETDATPPALPARSC